MKDEFYLRVNTHGIVELRVPIDIPQLDLDSIVDDLIGSTPEVLGEGETYEHKSYVGIQTCESCMGTGKEAEEAISHKVTSWSQRNVGWGHPPINCTDCGGEGNFVC